jgi:hypothetical protein
MGQDEPQQGQKSGRAEIAELQNIRLRGQWSRQIPHVSRPAGRNQPLVAPGLPELEGPAFGISYSTPMGVLRTRQGIGWRTNV